MCYSAEVSIFTFIFASIISIFIYLRNKNLDRLFVKFYMCILIIQLLEYFLWNNLNNKKNNELLTYIIRFTIAFQPFYVYLIICDIKYSIIGLIFSIIILFNSNNSIKYSKSNCYNNNIDSCKLDWGLPLNKLGMFLWSISLLYPAYILYKKSIKNNKNKKYIYKLKTVLLFISLYGIYWFFYINKSNASRFCYYGIFLIILREILIYLF